MGGRGEHVQNEGVGVDSRLRWQRELSSRGTREPLIRSLESLDLVLQTVSFLGNMTELYEEPLVLTKD